MADHYLGVDLGSSYTKFVVIDDKGDLCFSEVVRTLTRDRSKFNNIVEKINTNYSINKSCSTGYGRNTYPADLKKTELICASSGVSFKVPDQEKTILDIGGEDIKIIRCKGDGTVVRFSMNDKCSAGTGAFITEIAERAELDLSQMSAMAEQSDSERQINSFCTVFAKSEILTWIFDGTSDEDIARGIYLSIVNRVCKLPLTRELPVYLCGGVIAYHPYLQVLLQRELNLEVQVAPYPQYSVAYGAAVLAKKGV